MMYPLKMLEMFAFLDSYTSIGYIVIVKENLCILKIKSYLLLVENWVHFYLVHPSDHYGMVFNYNSRFLLKQIILISYSDRFDRNMFINMYPQDCENGITKPINKAPSPYKKYTG